MFDIKPYNKMLITKGDAAAFNVEIVDLDDKETYEPAKGDTLELNVFTDEEILLTKTADYLDGSWSFTFGNSDTKDIGPSVYEYNIVLYSDGEPYTIIDTTAFEVLGTKPDEEESDPQEPYDGESDDDDEPHSPSHIHNFVLYESIEPNCFTSGYKIYKCSECGLILPESGEPALGHNYVDGYCTRCGDRDPNYIPEYQGEHNPPEGD